MLMVSTHKMGDETKDYTICVFEVTANFHEACRSKSHFSFCVFLFLFFKTTIKVLQKQVCSLNVGTEVGGDTPSVLSAFLL